VSERERERERELVCVKIGLPTAVSNLGAPTTENRTPRRGTATVFCRSGSLSRLLPTCVNAPINQFRRHDCYLLYWLIFNYYHNLLNYLLLVFAIENSSNDRIVFIEKTIY
jgi:hypothetical protein